MTVTFTKGPRTCGWTALRPPRTQVPGSTMASGADLPHDLATFVIEQALRIDHGFWGCVAEDVTFRSLDRKRTPQGKAVIARHQRELDEAERRVNSAVLRVAEGPPDRRRRRARLDARAMADVDEGGALVVNGRWPEG